MSKTVKQIADELGVSKQAVHQKRKTKAMVTALQPFTTTVDGVVYISKEGEELLKEAFSGTDRKAVDDNKFTAVDGQVDAPEHPLYAILQAELAAKNRQIEQLQTQVSELTLANKALAQSINADRHNELAGTMQQLLPDAGELVPKPSGPAKKKKGLFGWRRKKED